MGKGDQVNYMRCALLFGDCCQVDNESFLIYDSGGDCLQWLYKVVGAKLIRVSGLSGTGCHRVVAV